MTPAEWHSTLFQFIGLILSLATFIGSIVAIYYTCLLYTSDAADD